MAQQVWHERIVANLECCLFQKELNAEGSGIDEAASAAGFAGTGENRYACR